MTEEDRADIAEAIAENGGEAALTRVSEQSFNDVTGKIEDGAETHIACKAVIGSIRITVDGMPRFVATATMIEEPLVNDRLTIGGRVYTITEVDPYAPDGGEPIAFTAVLR